MSFSDEIYKVELAKVVPSLIIAKGDKGDTGETGQDGTDGNTPQLRINSETNYWEVSYDNGTTWVSTDVKATGDKGEPGENGNNVFEIWEQGTKTNYTGNEILALKADNAMFTIKGYPVIAMQDTVSNSLYAWYIEPGEQFGIVLQQATINKTYKAIAWNATPQNIPLMINNKSATATGALTLNADDISATEQYAPSSATDIATKGYVDSKTGIIEKVLEVSMDSSKTSYNADFIIGTGYGNGYSAMFDGNKTGQGGLFEKAIVTGIEAYVDAYSIWADVNTLITEGISPFIPAKPFFDANAQATVLMFTDAGGSAVLDYVTTIRIHYIEITGTETVTLPSA